MKNNTVRVSPSIDATISTAYVELYKDSPSNQNEPHIHKETEIYVNISGDVVFEVGNKIYSVKRGSVIITPPYEYHRCIYLSEELHRHYWILIGCDSHDALFNFLSSNGETESRHVRLEEEVLGKLESTLDMLISKSSSCLKQNIAFFELLSILSEEKDIPFAESEATLPADVLLALKYMDGHIGEPIDLSELARASFVSVNTLERHFKDTLGVSPSVMLKRKRLIYSTRFLRDGTSVLEACERSGFTDYSGYISAFRLFFGMTPLKYKKGTSENTLK